MSLASWVGSRADRPLVAGIAFAASALAYTAAYVRFVSPYGLFVVSASVLAVSATLGAFVSGVVVWRYPLSWTDGRSYRAYGLMGLLVGSLTLVVAPPLAILGMTLPQAGGYSADVSLVTPIIVAGYLINAVAWGLVGTFVALVATLGTPMVVTTAVGLGLGYLRRRHDEAPAASAAESPQ
ncbi:hypothetical protein [Halosimplex salinum]|uniref:hypothetical protein n=1 Tax=Halosimplex salinum TaxID=1710538 RepID=UPI000F47EBB9|nr:hypothetical protein [Halosimplex salinum]